jgi:glutamate-ammonia-ligase adenylyltransferase
VTIFKNAELTQKAKERLEQRAGRDLTQFFQIAFEDNPDPDLALINLERWLNATSNPDTHLAHLADLPRLSKQLLLILGSGQHLADGLIQNPELAGVVTDTYEVSRLPSKEEIESEGRMLLSAASTYAHKLDRIRYLKQRWKMPIVVNDLAANWEPEEVWRVLSDLADVILTLAMETTWGEYSARRSLGEECPIMVVAFGKLGGHEVNYSSDVDLVYVLKDDAPEELERHAARFCELFSRSLADQMGRGSLYRVDLRLRPFGSSGNVCPTMRAVEAYYRSHAEVWETQALIRSRPVCGQPSLWPRWTALRHATCFRRSMSELALQEIIATRERIEGFSTPDDLKRGPGGIRDVEFLAQVLQMLHGYAHPPLREGTTCEVLRSVGSLHLLEHQSVSELIGGYTFLRQLEHRLQIVGDQQTHSIPPGEAARDHLAKLMSLKTWHELEVELDEHRTRIRNLYSSALKAPPGQARRDAVLESTDPSIVPQLAKWFDSLPESEAYYSAVYDDAEAFSRVQRIIREAPALLADLQHSVSLTESLINGELLESEQATFSKTDPPSLSKAFLAGRTRYAAKWALGDEFALGSKLSNLLDAVLRKVHAAIGASFDILALGSYGTEEIALASDLDLLLLIPDGTPHDPAENEAQQFLSVFAQMKREGLPYEIDLRLRPEGGKGLLVRTYAGLQNYELEGMEMWERFALGQARLVQGKQSSEAIVLKAAYALPLTPERLAELATMKKRIETERVQPQYWKRQVKLGFGGISDIDWFVHLFEMRYPTATEAGTASHMPERIRSLFRAQLINAIEYEELLSARAHLLDIRDRLALMGMVPDVIPENPDKLDQLAHSAGYESGNAFLAQHERVIETVRSIYLDGLERLGA